MLTRQGALTHVAMVTLWLYGLVLGSYVLGLLWQEALMLMELLWQEALMLMELLWQEALMLWLEALLLMWLLWH